jgi:MATE family multidrug resistance protein
LATESRRRWTREVVPSFAYTAIKTSRRIPSIACQSENIWFGEPPMSNLRHYATELGKTLALAFPIMAGQVGQMLMGLIDTLMVGHLGTIPLAGAAFGLSLVSVAFVCGIGFLSSVGVLVAQAHGARMEQTTRTILPSSIWLSLATGTVLAILLALLRQWFFLFHLPPEILDQALPFLVIVGWSLVPALAYISAKIFCESLSKPLVPMLMMYLGVSLNIFLNWVFIFGNLGAPALGLTGAGWATLISRTVTMFGTLFYCLHVTKSNLSDLSPARVRLPIIRALIRIGLPVGFQHLSEVAAFAFAAILMGLIGTPALAAHQIAIMCAATTFMFPLGISQAVTVRISQAVGAQSHSMVRIIAFSGLALSGLVMLFFAFLYLGLGPSIAEAFSGDREVVALASSLLIIAGIFQVADGVQVTAMGVLRGLADVRVPMLLAFMFYWLFAIPIGYLGAFIYRAGAVGIWSGLAIGLFIAAATLTTRMWCFTRPGKIYETLVHSEHGAVL